MAAAVVAAAVLVVVVAAATELIDRRESLPADGALNRARSACQGGRLTAQISTLTAQIPIARRIRTL